ncbi:MAG TPA: glycosyltransferase family 2 protein [Streptosporangiaceae bacterium]|nr:glycosyltransferase family 2 protein [Streptosporangiaceae bacterium]
MARAHARRDRDLRERIDCGIIIVTYNSADHVEALLDSLPAAIGKLSTRCVVVDNNSSDETISVLGRRHDAEVLRSTRNLGYSGAINLGRTSLGPCSSILILNPDLVVAPGAIEQLYEALNHGDIGVAVPKILSSDGELFLSLRREPSLARAIGEALFGSRLAWRPGWLSDTIRDRAAYQQPRDVDWAGGAALLISAACNEAVGDWDADRFFLYSEETDFAARVRRCGYRIRYVPSAEVCHEGGGSGRSAALGALLAVNRVRYYEKYHGQPASSIFRLVVAFHYLLRCSDLADRRALHTVLRRSRWASLPGGVAR